MKKDLTLLDKFDDLCDKFSSENKFCDHCDSECIGCELCVSCERCSFCRNCESCFECYDSNHLRGCIETGGSTFCDSCVSCEECLCCSNCVHCEYCEYCENCLCCFNLIGTKENPVRLMVLNQQVTQEEYDSYMVEWRKLKSSNDETQN